MGGLSTKQKEEKIDAFFDKIYNKLYLNSRSQYQFEKNLEKEIPEELSTIKDDKDVSGYYKRKKKEKIDKFVVENQLRENKQKSIDEENLRKQNFSDIFRIGEFIIVFPIKKSIDVII